MLNRTWKIVFLLLSVSPFAHAGDLPCVPGQVDQSIDQFTSLRTGYYPNGSRMEGGFKDRAGRPLRTLQDYLKGKVSYVSVAMDYKDTKLPYGTILRIPSVEKEFGRCIQFRVVDTGGRFKNKGTKKIDLCNDNRQHSLESYTNGLADVYVVGHAR
ncbi:MAG: hypothetical protein ACXVB9_05255 [Bdellovibrionota bacterium]